MKLATIMFPPQDLQCAEQKASENAVLVEKYQMEIQDQHQQIQELIGEKEAAKAMVQQSYRYDVLIMHGIHFHSINYI